jgi:sterol desaturase/sphingolipid hydroxylase (fatty acid hydroxylase superfamily)
MIDLTANMAHVRPTAGAFLPIALAFILAEYVYARLTHHDEQHDTRETLASVGVAVGDVLSRILTGGIAAIPFVLLYQNRLFEIPLNHPLSWIALFLSVEFFYYWFHRASHRIRWFWATHAVHHSATRFNLSAAIRLGWTGALTGAFIFFLPLAWLGFHPIAVVAMLGVGLN